MEPLGPSQPVDPTGEPSRATAGTVGEGVASSGRPGFGAPSSPSSRSGGGTILDADTVAYVSEAGGEPWGYPGNLNALDDVFGPGNWDRLDFATAVGNGLWGYDLILMDGGNGATLEFIDFVNANRADMETWVNGGGWLIINAARWDDASDFDLGFGITLIDSGSSNGYAVDTSHPVYDGPFGTTGSDFSGSSLSHDYVTGAGLTSLMTGDHGFSILSEMNYGSGHVIAGGLTLPFFGEHDSWSPNCPIFHRNLLAYAGAGPNPPDGMKYVQPVDCNDPTMYFSNLNSSTNNWMRFDDFICTQTGDITQVSFWGGMTDNDPTANISTINIDFYEWVPDGPCGFLPGALLCSYAIPAAQLSYVYECDWAGIYDIYKYTVDLPDPCFQTEGQHFVLRIAATLNDPGAAIFMWTTSTALHGTAGASYNTDQQIWECGNLDQAFELYTEAPGGKYAQPVNCEGPGYFSNVNSNVSSWLRYDDFICNQTGDINRVVFWGGMYFDCGPKDNLAAIQVDFYQWLPDGPCGFLPGDLLCSQTIPAADLAVEFECESDVGLPHFRYTANLPEPCFQEEGQHFVIMIAGIVEDPDADCVFYWSESSVQYGTQGGSYNQDSQSWTCHGTDNAFELYTEPAGKYAQPPNCDSPVWFSNLYHNLNPWLRLDDFVCNQTGDITRVEFWGSGFDVDLWQGCGLPHVQGFLVQFYQWLPEGDCEWGPGDLLCSSEIPWDDVAWEYECTGPNGDYYRFTVDLPQPCPQVEGEHYVLLIAGVPTDPNDPCIFGWVETPQIHWSPAASFDLVTGSWFCGGPDQAFALFTVEPDCPADVNGDGKVDIDDLFQVLGAWGTCDNCPEDINDDSKVDIDDIFAVLGAWGPC
ncbi:MAG: hypothetical protein JSV91_04285 [Phycisphaerales bacterium]|nr:MAG: hypothetical protein JSV91_04285 [Phycisphaerales bacterium]